MGRGEVNFAQCATIISRGSNVPDDRIRARRYLGRCSFQPGWVPDRTFPKFHLPFSKIERCLSVAGDGAYHSTQEGAMQRTFFIIARSRPLASPQPQAKPCRNSLVKQAAAKALSRLILSVYPPRPRHPLRCPVL